MRMMIRHGLAVKWRRLVAIISFLVLCFMLTQWVEDDENVSNKISQAIHPSTESVVLPHEETVLVQPWESKSCQTSGSQSHAHPYLLFMIISSPENFEHRKIIREVIHRQLNQWEKVVMKMKGVPEMDATIKALFFVGQPPNGTKESVGEELLTEAQTHGDMVYENLSESYLNLTVKTLRMLKWVGQHCNNVRYLVKLDDDVYLNVPALLNFLHQLNPDPSTESKSDHLIAGFKYNKIKIDSDPTSKWYTPPSIWDGDRFPDFVSGICYVLGSHARRDLYKNALQTPLFHLEDVFLTGIVRERHLSSEVVNIPGIRVGWFLNDKMETFPCNFVKNVVAAHTLSPSQVGCYSKMEEYCGSGFWSWFPLFILCG